MSARTAVAMAGVSVAVLVLTGCTTSRAGTATPGPTGTAVSEPSESSDTTPESSTPRSEEETYGAPRVATPLDASKFLTDPCAVLTQVQLTGFGVSRTGIPDTDSEIAKHSGPACIWHAAEVDSSIGVNWITGNKNGLSDTYRIRDQWKYFEETTVEGHPAVFNSQTDARSQGDCHITVGISDTLTFGAMEQGRLDAQGACDRVKQVAAATIQTLRGS